MDDIILSDSEIGKCYKFSYHVTKQTDEYYKKRNQYASTEKIITDHFIAKLAELYVYYYLANNDYVCSYPDFKITDCLDTRYKKHSFDPDLIVFKGDEKLHIHIKCVRFDSPVKDSWLIQENDKCVLNPGENDYFALCVFHSPEKIELKKLILASRIKWQETRNKLPSKRACYLNDLEKPV